MGASRRRDEALGALLGIALLLGAPAGLALLLGAPAAGGERAVPLIPRAVLFAEPERTQVRVSPDGRRLSYLAPSPEGVRNVWVRTLGRADDRQLSRDRQRGIRSHAWAGDGRHLLYLQAVGEGEAWHLHAADVESGAVRDLTPFDGARAREPMLAPGRPGELLVALNRGDRHVFDVYRVDLASGAIRLDTSNPGDVVAWYADPALRVRGAVALDPRDGSRTLRVRDAPPPTDAADAPAAAATEPAWRPLARWSFEESGGVAGFDAAGGVILETSAEADTSYLLVVDVATGEVRTRIEGHPRADVGRLLLHPETRALQAVSFEYLRPEWRVLDPALAGDLAALAKVQPGHPWVISRDGADRTWIVAFERDDGPTAYYRWRREAKRAERLFVDRPALAALPLTRREPLEIRARDGLLLPAYLARPPGVAGPAPLVLKVHGGPWARDRWGWEPAVQWLANRGYGVLEVNFRGSEGLGRRFLEAGHGEWGVGAMQHDLSDAVRWAIEAGHADPTRVCVYGSAYGGYAVLAGLAFTPELYACGIDRMGPANLKTLLRSVPSAWKPMKQRLIHRVGNVEKERDLNRRLSPLFHLDAIRAPLFVVQGGKDPRVKQREANRLVAALRKRELPVTYVVYPDEERGPTRAANRLDFYGRAEQFLAEHLGGRAEPFAPVPGASAEPR